MQQFEMGGYEAKHFRYVANGNVATITLDRPERRNPLTFEAYAELGGLFRKLAHASDIKAVVFTGAGGNFCSGGDVHEIIGPLVAMDMPGLLRFTRMTGELVKALPLLRQAQAGRRAPQQAHPERALQSRDQLADGRLRGAERAGRAREAAQLHAVHEGFEGAQGVHGVFEYGMVCMPFCRLPLRIRMKESRVLASPLIEGLS